jgi:ACS family hexuronate transporter-like MFS transporter
VNGLRTEDGNRKPVCPLRAGSRISRNIVSSIVVGGRASTRRLPFSHSFRSEQIIVRGADGYLQLSCSPPGWDWTLLFCVGNVARHMVGIKPESRLVDRTPLSHLRWVMIALVFAATAINYLDRQAFSVVVPLLMTKFHMTAEAFSRTVLAFMLAYTIMNLVSGPMIDRLGTRLGYALTAAWWSIAAMLTALATGAWSLGVFQFLLGMGEAGNWPAGVKVTAEWFPVRERALASGIFNSGSAVGAIVAPPLIVWIVLREGWRASFVAVGLAGLAWVVIWSLTYRTPKDLEVKRRSTASPWTLFRTRFVWSFTTAKVFLDPVWYFYIFWFPEYLKRARHFDFSSIGRYAWIPFLVAGAGNILGGLLSAFLLWRGFSLSMARKMAVSVFCLLMTATIPAVFVRQSGISIALVSLAMLGYTGVTANMLAFPADVFPATVVASVWGLAGLGSGVGGMVFALATGWLVDRYSYVPVFVGFGLLPIVALFIIWFVLGPLRPILLPDRQAQLIVPS